MLYLQVLCLTLAQQLDVYLYLKQTADYCENEKYTTNNFREFTIVNMKIRFQALKKTNLLTVQSKNVVIETESWTNIFHGSKTIFYSPLTLVFGTLQIKSQFLENLGFA